MSIKWVAALDAVWNSMRKSTELTEKDRKIDWSATKKIEFCWRNFVLRWTTLMMRWWFPCCLWSARCFVRWPKPEEFASRQDRAARCLVRIARHDWCDLFALCANRLQQPCRRWNFKRRKRMASGGGRLPTDWHAMKLQERQKFQEMQKDGKWWCSPGEVMRKWEEQQRLASLKLRFTEERWRCQHWRLIRPQKSEFHQCRIHFAENK